jgi:hypothetical protein
LHLKTRGTSMSETPNDNIRRVKTSSTFFGRLQYAHQVVSPLDLLTPLWADEDPPK